MSQSEPIKTFKTNPFLRRVILYTVLSFVFFLLGFVPMWIKVRDCSTALFEADKQLTLARIQNLLGSAVINAQRGDYGKSLQATSDFFTALRTETDNLESSVFTPTEKAGIMDLYPIRDDLIALLARKDPSSTARLFVLYEAYLKVVN
jgi:hypothetical protein